MASKKITRTLIESYDYDVMRRNSKGMELVGTIANPKSIRSMKEQKEVLKANEFLETDVLVLIGTTQKQYEMEEEDFKKYATVVTAVEETEKNETAQAE